MNQKEEIIKVGLKLFSSQPYSATGIRQIMQEVGLPTGSFHYYFKNKEDFSISVLDYFFEQELPSKINNNQLYDESISAKDKVILFFQLTINFHRNNSSENRTSSCIMGNLGQEVACSNENIAQSIRHYFNKSHLAIETILAMGAKDKSIQLNRSPKKLAKFLFDAYEGALMRRKIEGSEEPMNEFLSVLKDIL